MLSVRTSMRSAAVVLGMGIALTFSMTAPASAANEGTYMVNTPNCSGTEEIALRTVDGATHDWMEFFPTTGVSTSGCQFGIKDASGKNIWISITAGSGWIYDGPGNYLCPWTLDMIAGFLGAEGRCN